MYKIAVLPGDGTGPEVVREGLKVLGAAAASYDFKYELTEFHFLELIVETVGGKEVYPGEDRVSVKMWPEDKMKLHYTLDYIAP